MYQNFCGRLYDGPQSLGLCILYDWPSLGSVAGYEPDRASARDCAGDLADILSELFDWLLRKQQDAIDSAGDPKRSCRARVLVIAHSMGKYVLEKDGDCSSFFPPSVGGLDIHGAYFVTDDVIELMRQILRGIDRGVLDTLKLTKGNAWSVQTA